MPTIERSENWKKNFASMVKLGASEAVAKRHADYVDAMVRAKKQRQKP